VTTKWVPGDKNILKLHSSDICHCKYILKLLNCTLLKRVNFKVYELYLKNLGKKGWKICYELASAQCPRYPKVFASWTALSPLP
jgi:hypothetical protein